MAGVLHIVSLEVKNDVAPERLEEAFEAARGLRSKIEGVLEVSAGPNLSPEQLENGFTHGLVFRFADIATRDRFLDHPDHSAAGALLGPLVGRVLVLEIEAAAVEATPVEVG